MFILAGKFSFEPDQSQCWLAASCDYESPFSWAINLGSQCTHVHFTDEAEPVEFAVHVQPPLGIRHWLELSGRSFVVPPESLHMGFKLEQWEDLQALQLRFGQTRGTQIEVWADGCGCVEAAPDFFPDGQVEFQIQTWVNFNGVSVNVPLSAGDPIAYSKTRIKALLEKHDLDTAKVRRTCDASGELLAVEVLFQPNRKSS
jgi:hypothetical protein